MHKTLHGIMQSLLLTEVKFQFVQPLMKLYTDKAMPVTDYSITTLSCILNLFYSKYNHQSAKQQCLAWLLQNDITCNNMLIVQDLLLRLVANENVDMTVTFRQEQENQALSLHEILLDTEKSLLYSKFEYDAPTLAPVPIKRYEKIEQHYDSERLVRETLTLKLEEHSQKFSKNQIKPIEFAKYVQITYMYCDILLKYTDTAFSQLKMEPIFCALRSSIRMLFAALIQMLKNCKESAEEVRLLNSLGYLLRANSERPLISELCRQMNEDFFHSIHKVINSIGKHYSDEEIDTDDLDTDSMNMRFCCIHLLASYCKVDAEYRHDILDLILDPKLYNFLIWEDIECAFQCIRTLIDASVETPPMGMLNNFLMSSSNFNRKTLSIKRFYYSRTSVRTHAVHVQGLIQELSGNFWLTKDTAADIGQAVVASLAHDETQLWNNG